MVHRDPGLPEVLARVQEEFGVEMPLRQLFEQPTIAEGAAWIEAARAVGPGARPAEAARIPCRAADEFTPLSSAEMRLWFFDQLQPHHPVYNMPVAARLVGPSSDVAAALVAWTPAMMIVAGWCWMEWPTVGLTILSIFAWQQFCESPSARSLAVSSLALAGALASLVGATRPRGRQRPWPQFTAMSHL